MNADQRGVWLVQWALYRGSRHARKQRIVKRNLETVGLAWPLMDFDEYDARREARGTE